MNDYDRDVFNGDVGVIADVKDGRVFVDFPGQERFAGRQLAWLCRPHSKGEQTADLPAWSWTGEDAALHFEAQLD